MKGFVQSAGSKTNAPRPFQPHPADLPQSSTSGTDQETIFINIHTYPWNEDAEFQAGLSSILGTAEPPASGGQGYHEIGLVLEAQCFYFARKFNVSTPIDVAAYKSWMNKQAQSKPVAEPAPINTRELLYDSPHNQSSSANTPPLLPQNNKNSSSDPSIVSQTSSAPASQPSSLQPSRHPSQPQPPYPTTFASIVDLIARNQPIPGIEEIPSTNLDASLSAPNKTPKRRKPWEKDVDAENDTTTITNHANTIEGKEQEEVEKEEEGNPGDNTWIEAIKRGNEDQGAKATTEENQEGAADDTNHLEPHSGEVQSQDTAG